MGTKRARRQIPSFLRAGIPNRQSDSSSPTLTDGRSGHTFDLGREAVRCTQVQSAGVALFRANELDTDRACILVVDLQEKLLPLTAGWANIVASTEKLIDGASIFGLPAIVTEQYPKGLGPTHAPLADRLRRTKARFLEKPTFSACRDSGVQEALRSLNRHQVVVAGIETHVCVQQTTLDLRSRDYDVFVCADAVGSRGELDHERSLQRMQQAGAYITTVESVLFELCGRCDTAEFKRMLEVIKNRPPSNGQRG